MAKKYRVLLHKRNLFVTLQSLNTVRLVQLVEHQIVVLVVVGSSPTAHPIKKEEADFSVSSFFIHSGRII